MQKKKLSREENILRVPRPLGFTYALITTRKNPETRDSRMESLRKKIIQLWVSDNMIYQGKVMTIGQMAMYLNMPQTKLLKEMHREVSLMSGFFEGNEGKELTRVLTLGTIKKGSEILARIDQQSRILMARQGNKYVPFLTSEVNKANANLINATKPMLDIIKLLTEKVQSPIFMNIDQRGNGNQHYLSPDDAVRMITENGTQNEEKLLAEMGAKFLELGYPDVSAKTQNLTSIGIRNVPKTDTENGTQERYRDHHTKIPNQVDQAEDFVG